MRPRPRRGWRAALLLLALLPILPATAAEDAELAETYRRLAFGPADEAPALWRDAPVRVALLGEPGRGFRAGRALGLLLARLSALTGLALQPGADAAAEITLVFAEDPARDLRGPYLGAVSAIFPLRSDREREMAGLRGVDCKAWFAHEEGPPPRMVRVLAVLRRSQAAEGQWACMVDVLVRSLGFRENRTGAEWSMLNTAGPWLEPTEEDRLLLRLLYDPALATVAEPAAARRIAQGLLESWRPAAAR